MEPTTPPDVTPEMVLRTTIKEEGSLFLIRVLFLLFIGIALGLVTLLLVRSSINNQTPSSHRAGLPGTEALTPAEAGITPLPQLTLEARAAYVLDLHSGTVLYAKNAEAQLPLASLTKLMTVLVAQDLFSKVGSLTIPKEALLADGGSGILPDETWVPRDLFTFTLVQSSNNGARAIASVGGALGEEVNSDYALARERFVEHMNKKAQALALTQTYFLNETGLDETEQVGGGYGSAKDVAWLLREMLATNQDVLEGTRYDALLFSTLENREHVAINTNQDLRAIPSLIASKTGFTDLAGGNLAIAFDRGINRPVIVVVLGSSKEGRFSDVQTIVDTLLTPKEAQQSSF